MPQNNIYLDFIQKVGSAFVQKPALLDAQQEQLTAVATSSLLNITAVAVAKASAGKAARVSVIVAGSAAGSVNDCATTGAVAAANQIFAIPNTVGVYALEWPCANGITVTPGTGQTIAISYI